MPADHPPIAPVDTDPGDEQALQDALEKNPGHVPILLQMAELALSNGRPQEAVARLRAAVEAEPENAEARLELGRALWEAGDREGAAAETLALLEIEPDYVDALYNLGAIYANQKQPEKAKEYWARAVEVAPMSPSGQSAQRGLDILSGRPASIPDIPEHRGLQSTAPNGTPERLGAGDRDRIIQFATSN